MKCPGIIKRTKMGKKQVHDEGVFAMNETEQSKFVGFTCAYTPLPLIHAAGFVPYRIFPVGDWPDRAGQMLHEVDAIDARHFAEGQLRTRITAFVEMLEGRPSPWN